MKRFANICHVRTLFHSFYENWGEMGAAIKMKYSLVLAVTKVTTILGKRKRGSVSLWSTGENATDSL